MNLASTAQPPVRGHRHTKFQTQVYS